MNCIIVDDEPLARAELEAMIREVSSIKILGKFPSAARALQFLRENEVDLIFLDIEMPMVSGIEFASQLPKNILVVFTTAYPQYALKSYELDAIDYLLKPVEPLRLAKSINKAEVFKRLLSDDTEKITLESNNKEFLLIKSERKFHRVNFDDIRYIEGLKDYVILCVGNQRLITAMNLKTIHQKMPAHLFLRVSKSYVVNIKHIDSFDHHALYLGETEIPLGEVYKKDFFTIYSGGTLNPE